MDAAWDAGIRWFDTADAYGGGRSESCIGRWRADRRPAGRALDDEGLQPGHGRAGRPRPRAATGSGASVDGSLERLGVERDRPLPRPRARPGRRRSPRRSARSRSWSPPGRSAPGALSNYDAAARGGARARGRPGRSSRTRTRCSTAATRTTCCRSAPSTGSPTCRSARSRAAGSTGKYRARRRLPGGLADDACAPSRTRTSSTTASSTALDALAAEAARARRVDGRARARLGARRIRTSTAVVVGPSRPEHLEPVLAALDVPLSPGERDRIGSFFAVSRPRPRRARRPAPAARGRVHRADGRGARGARARRALPTRCARSCSRRTRRRSWG